MPSIDEVDRDGKSLLSHNPNLAVVCGAEQIIYAAIDMKNKNRVEYLTGAIENKEINKKLLNVLEETNQPLINATKVYSRMICI